MKDVELNFQAVQARIKIATQVAGRDKSPVLLAVSKRHGAEKIRDLVSLGQLAFGESYVQEALGKIQALSDVAIQWHYIGPVQSNKTKPIAENFDWVQSVDRMKILLRLNEQRPLNFNPLQVLLQYKVGDEASKSGADTRLIFEMAEAISSLPRLQLRGLMCIPPPSNDKAVQAANFAEVRQVFERLKSQFGQIDTLSMGMSNDLEAAIEAGSTMLRVGTDIFGSRT